MARQHAAAEPGGSTSQPLRRDMGATWTYVVVGWFALTFGLREILSRAMPDYGSIRALEYLTWTAILVISILLCFRLGRDFRESDMATRMLQLRIREARASAGAYRPRYASKGLQDLHGLTLASRDREYELAYQSRQGRLLAYILAILVVVPALAVKVSLSRGLLVQAMIMIFAAGLLIIFAFICALIASRKRRAADGLGELQHDIEEAAGYYHKTQQRQKRDERDQRRPFVLPPKRG